MNPSTAAKVCDLLIYYNFMIIIKRDEQNNLVLFV
jgi:hypothetical protein